MIRMNNFHIREYISFRNAFNITSWQTTKQFGTLFSDKGFSSPEDSKGYVQTLFQKYIIPKCYKKPITYFEYTIYSDDEEKREAKEEAIEEWLSQLYVWIEDTEYRYNEIISNQEAELSHLMDEVKSTTVNKFNDTPQTDTETEADEFNTNVTTTVQSNELTTKLQRIKELKEDLKNIYAEWLKEFEKELLIYKFNYED